MLKKIFLTVKEIFFKFIVLYIDWEGNRPIVGDIGK